MDARDFNLRSATKFVTIRPSVRFSPFQYLFMLMPTVFLAWYWAGQALHRMELEWARKAGGVRDLAESCQVLAAAPCESYLQIAQLHGWSLLVLLFVPKFMLLAASLPKWPPKWQEAVMRHAAWFGALGLLITLLLVMGRGAIVASAAWLLPPVWWGAETKAVQLAPVLAMIAIMRVPPHAKMAWRLWGRFNRRRVGRVVERSEQAAIWELIDSASRKLGVKVPDHLVLGVFPDCRLEVGKMTLDPFGKVIKGDILYLGITLRATLEAAQLQHLIEHALLRRRGTLGKWLPDLEDWLESTGDFVRECRDKRAAMELGNAVDPAITCWDGWLHLLRQMALPFQEEHARARALDMQEEAEFLAREAKTLLYGAQRAYRKDVFHLFIVNLTCGVVCPSVLRWFAKAFAGYYPAAVAQTLSPAEAALNEELILLEKEWLIKTGQASTPRDCWELRAA